MDQNGFQLLFKKKLELLHIDCLADSGETKFRHQDQIWRDHRAATGTTLNANKPPLNLQVPGSEQVTSTPVLPTVGLPTVPDESPPQPSSATPPATTDDPALRCSKRTVHPPEHLNL